MARPNPFLLAADNSPVLLTLLNSNPSLASVQDEHGYSLLHAAASYNHHDLAEKLVHDFGVDVNIKDEDGESPLFSTDTVEAARFLVENLHADISLLNTEGLTARLKILEDGDYPLIAAYLLEKEQTDSSLSAVPGSEIPPDSTQNTNGIHHHPPPMPEGISVDIGATDHIDETGNDVVDPELRRRIEDLAQREDFQSEEGQSQLRELVTQAIRGHVVGDSQERDTRRRIN
jgi:ankyrin repeat protein